MQRIKIHCDVLIRSYELRISRARAEKIHDEIASMSDKVELFDKHSKSTGRLNIKSLRRLYPAKYGGWRSSFLFTAILPVHEGPRGPIDYVLMQVHNLQFAIQLAHPGCVAIQKAKVYSGNMVLGETEQMMGALELAVGSARKNKWPKIQHLNTADVWRWLNTIPNYAQGIPTGRVGRAVSAMSYLVFNENESFLDHIWAILGLEALYGKGEQLLKKSEALLGPRESSRELAAVYNFRSRLLHGDLNFPLDHAQYYTDWIDITDKTFTFKTIEAVSLATSVLIGSIQKLAINKWTDVEFDVIAHEAKKKISGE